MNSLKKSRKAKLLRAVAIIVVIFAAAGLLYVVFSYIDSASKQKEAERLANIREKVPSYVFFEPDYDENIFDDKAYIAKNRSVAYTDGNMTLTITDGDFSRFPLQLAFMNDYLQNIINGRVDEFNAQHSEVYYEKYEPKDSFTMQKLYNIEVELLESYEMTVSASAIRYDEYLVSYMIKNPNGTFRNDLPEESYVPQIIKVRTEGNGTILIDDVQRYKAYQEN